MRIYIIIPAHNEELLIKKTLTSLVEQTYLPTKIVVVNDNSTDNTETVVSNFIKKHDYISIVNTFSSTEHLPGSKVINAFYQGFHSVDNEYDIICKFDADLIFPNNYLESIVSYFKQDQNIGMAGGFCYIKSNLDTWILENLTNKDHIRGALKAYRKECFEQIGGLKTAMGWDTIDELLAQFHHWKIKTDSELHVKHLKPTGNTYNKKAKYKQGIAFYKMRYGLLITIIASIKLALLKKRPQLIFDYIIGFFKAMYENHSFLVSKTEGKFIRALRWKKIRSRFLKF